MLRGRSRTKQCHVMESFDYSRIPSGYYNRAVTQGNPIRRAWHIEKFERIKAALPSGAGLSILDIGTFNGDFLARLPESHFSVQIGVDILENQIAYAAELFGTSFRRFIHVPSLQDMDAVSGTFDCITLIEIIEHLSGAEIRDLLEFATAKLKKGGRLLVSTPNYTSAWPLLELIIARVSDISYEAQHITRFNYFSVFKELRSIYPEFDRRYAIDFKTTSHFFTPFLACLSLESALKLSRRVDIRRWRFPFGNLIVFSLTRR